MSDQYPPHQPEGHPNPDGGNGPWQQGGSSTPPPTAPQQPGSPGIPGSPGSPWASNPEGTAPVGWGPPPEAAQPHQPGQQGGWPAPPGGGQQPGGWPTAPDAGQPGWGSQQPNDPQQWRPENQWAQQPTAQWQQPPGYQQGWQPPGAQPPGGGKKLNPVFVIVPLALVAAIVLGVVIALAVRDKGDKGKDEAISPLNPTSQPTTTTLPEPRPSAPVSQPVAAPPPDGAPPGAPNCAPVAPVGGPAPGGPEPVLDIGQTAHIVNDDPYDVSDFEANVTLNSVCTQSTAFDDYSDPPVQGQFVLANVTVEVIAGEVNATYFDFSVQTADGSRFAGDFPPVEPRLASFDLQAGGTVRGYVLVDAPPGNHMIRWEPTFATSVGLWRY